MRLNLGCGKKILDGFINVDKFAMPGVDQVVDLFRFPWPFESDTCEQFFCSHLIEHIPHETRMSYDIADKCANHPLWSQWRVLQDLDGFFSFFAEIWRVGKNDALVECVCPFGYTHMAFQDPTHTRVIVPQTIAYLSPEMDNNGNFDYHLPFHFKPEDFGISVDNQFAEMQKNNKELFNAMLGHSWDVGNEMRFTLRVVK